ncbi:6-carboxyhexanoate--CoA ligase [Sporosarcina ureilytica]|nr:6-carboxyhexanoate--CoA ligase [Sporosarcina ureilytica]
MPETMYPEYFSVRMRAAEGKAHELGGKHISGGERLGNRLQLEVIATELLAKASNHSRGSADFIQLVVEKVPGEELQFIPPLDVSAIEVATVQEGHDKAKDQLAAAGVSERAIEHAFLILNHERNLRGAAIVNCETGERLDERGQKGVRVSRMDWTDCGHVADSVRVREALALATKVAQSPYTVAELCWSDDPDYVTGYVSSQQLGYVRISPLKRMGCESGGRVFFVHNDVDIDSYIDFLERKPVFIQGGESE